MPDPVSVLLHLQRRAREAESPVELGFVMVNETFQLVLYRQAVLWERGRGISAVSGVAVPEANAPFTLFLERVCRRLAGETAPPGPIDPARLVEEDREQWNEWLPEMAMWLPLRGGGLLLAREKAWTEIETALLSEAAHAYGHALAALRRPSLWAEGRRYLAQRSRLLLGIAAATLMVAAIPVPLTVLAPGEVVAANPAVIRAPLDGVVERIAIRSNERVAPGQLLFSLDDTMLKGKEEVAEKALATAEASLRQISQQAVFDSTAKPKLALAIGRRDEQRAELDYLKSQLDRIRVTAPKGGIAIIDDPPEWIGRPVSVGEKVMELAEERDTEIEAWLAPADAIDLVSDAPLTLFLNVSPLSPVRARVRTVAYEATPLPDGTVAHRVRAVIEGDGPKPRLGLKGTARLSGQRVPLAYWLARRPIAVIRGWIGL